MKLTEIQQKLKAPKNQYNSFGGYNYRNCEDILEAVKPLLGASVLTLSDSIINVGDRYYVEATATFIDGDLVTSTNAFARETDVKKGMDPAQITGSASSYARKYALNGLFLIDDTKDPDVPPAADDGQHAPPEPEKLKVIIRPKVVKAELSKEIDPSPHKIDYKTGNGMGSDYTNFGQLFVGAINKALTHDLLHSWEDKNKEIIAEILTNAPRIGAALKDRIADAYARVRGETKEAAE